MFIYMILNDLISTKTSSVRANFLSGRLELTRTSNCTRQAEIVLKMVWLPKGVPEKRHSGNDRTVCELAVPVVVHAREGGKRRTGTPLENRAGRKTPRHPPHATQYPAMTDIIPAPAVLGTEVIGVFVVDAEKVPFVRVVVPVVGQCVAGLKLEPGEPALQSYDDRIVVRTSAAFLLPQNPESGVGPGKRIESRPGHRRRRIVQCQHGRRQVHVPDPFQSNRVVVNKRDIAKETPGQLTLYREAILDGSWIPEVRREERGVGPDVEPQRCEIGSGSR